VQQTPACLHEADGCIGVDALQAIGVDALVEQYHDWVKEHRGLLSLLVHGELKGITQSHVLMVSTAYMPGQYPLFKVRY
jgi:hypothetical protein